MSEPRLFGVAGAHLRTPQITDNRFWRTSCMWSTAMCSSCHASGEQSERTWIYISTMKIFCCGYFLHLTLLCVNMSFNLWYCYLVLSLRYLLPVCHSLLHSLSETESLLGSTSTVVLFVSSYQRWSHCSPPYMSATSWCNC